MSTVLVVDDSNLDRRMMRLYLENSGHTVVEAHDGVSALEVYANEQPDLVLLDLVMPGLYGMVVLERIMAIDHEAQVVIVSACGDSDTHRQALKIGAVGYLTKPYTVESFEEVLSAAQTRLAA